MGAHPPDTLSPVVAVDPRQISIFLDTVFGYCDGLIPVRSFGEKGQAFERVPQTTWLPADSSATDSIATFATASARNGMGVFVVPGTVADHGQAKASDVQQMQTLLIDLDHGDIAAKHDHLARHLGAPTLVVASGGMTPDGQDKLHLYWRLSEPTTAEDLHRLCRLRADIASKVGGDPSFGSAHQPIRVAGTIHCKHGAQRMVRIQNYRATAEYHLEGLTAAINAMPFMVALGSDDRPPAMKPSLDQILTTAVHEGGTDRWTRFEGASAAIGHHIRMAHEGRISQEECWEAVCQYNAAALRPSWALDRLKAEYDRLWKRHVACHGPASAHHSVSAVTTSMPAFTLGALLDDDRQMPADIISPRLLTPGGLLVLGGAPKVGKSDFLINLLAHMAAGTTFLGFTPPRPLRIFYLQAEIQYDYLRERLQAVRLDPDVIAAARDNLVVTPKLRMLLDGHGLTLAVEAIRVHFPDAPPDIICIDPIRNLFDGGPDGGGENDNDAMMFFLQARVEALREAVAPEAGIILAHHTRKLGKKQVAEDPFQALSGASALRGYYSSGIIMHRPHEERSERRLEIELRNGPAIAAKLIDKHGGQWVEVDTNSERLIRKEVGARLDAERVRKHDVILGLLLDEAEAGRLYTSLQFAEKFENKGGLGGTHTIRDRISVLATKGYIKFVRDGAPYGLNSTTSKFGYLCTEGMVIPGPDETVDHDTGELLPSMREVLPSHFKCPQSGAPLPVENPRVWVYQDESQ